MTTKETKTITIDELAKTIDEMKASLQENLQGQERTAINMQNIDQRITKLEGNQQKVNTDEKLEAAIEAAKPGLLGGFKQASTTKKVLIATAGTAAVAGVAYAGYKGYEYYQDRKQAGLPMIAVEAVPSVSPAKSDAIRQGLGSK